MGRTNGGRGSKAVRRQGLYVLISEVVRARAPSVRRLSSIPPLTRLQDETRLLFRSSTVRHGSGRDDGEVVDTGGGETRSCWSGRTLFNGRRDWTGGRMRFGLSNCPKTFGFSHP